MIPLGNIHHFTSEEAQKLLHNKFVVILGDSIHRAIYKDMIYFLQKKKMLTNNQLKLKPNRPFANDCVVEGGELHNKTSYREARQYRTDHHLVRFYFLTRIYSAYIESVLSDFNAGPAPDVVIVNSCLWDLNRYNRGVSDKSHLETAFREYWQNLDTFLGKLKDVLPTDCLVIWNTAMPLGRKVQHAYLENGMKNESTPVDIIKANFYSTTMACCYKFDVLDLHYCFRFLESKLDTDGVHWDAWVHRYITKLLLTHVANAWGVELTKKNKKKIRGIEWNGNTANQPPSPWLSLPPSQPPHLHPGPPHLHPGPPPNLRPRLPPPHQWPRPLPQPQPSPPAPHMFQSCSQFDDGFSPLQFSPSNDATFHCDFTSNHAPWDEFINWEDDQLPRPHPEEMHHNGFYDPNPVAQMFTPYIHCEMPRRAPQGHHNDLVMRRQPFRRQPGPAPYTVPRYERPRFQGWGPSY